MKKPAKLTRKEQKLWGTLQFLIRLIILSVPLYLVIFLSADLSGLQLWTAGATNWALTSLGWSVQQEGFQLTADGFTFFLNQDCTGWKSMLFLFALMFSVLGVSLRKRLLGILIGIPLIILGNLGRILGTVYAQAAWGTPAAMSIHDWGWQFGLIALVLGIWIVWLKSETIARKLGLLGRRRKK